MVIETNALADNIELDLGLRLTDSPRCLRRD